MASTRSGGSRKQRWCPQLVPLTPLMEGPDHVEMMKDLRAGCCKKESSWEVIREWFRTQRASNHLNSSSHSSVYSGGGRGSGSGRFFGGTEEKRQDLRLLLGVLGCPLAPIPLNDTGMTINHSNKNNNFKPIDDHHHYLFPLHEVPIESSSAHYIIQQYLAATGCLKLTPLKEKKNMYTTGVVKMVCCETEICSGGKTIVKQSSPSSSSSSSSSGTGGCFVVWQMVPGKWSIELVVGGKKVLAGSDGKIVWRHTPWLGTHAAKGPQRPLRRIIQGLDPKSTASLFANAQCLGEKQIGEEDCFVLKVAADRAAVMERNEGPAEVIRHVLYGYFSQKSGLLIYMEDSHLTRVVQQHPETPHQIQAQAGAQINEDDAVYWETTIGSSIGEYRDVDGVLIAHQGRSVATVFRFREVSSSSPTMQAQQFYSRTRMEEVWRIDDVVFNVPGLSSDSFIPPADIYL